MSTLDHAIDQLERLYTCFTRDGQWQDAKKVLHELWGYQDVRDGVPRSAREPMIHHVEYLGLYRQARQDAELLAGQRDERESNP